MDMLYADDMMISAESSLLLVKVKTWKSEKEEKGLCVNRNALI